MATNPTDVQRVKVVDFDMSITSLVGLFIKMAIASIPALMIIWFLAFLFGALAMTVLGVGGAALGG